MIRVYADMVADLFHYGHMAFLRQVRTLGDFLIVGICSDEEMASYKRQPILSMEERVASVAGCRYVDEVLPHAPFPINRDWIAQHDIHLVVHGDDLSTEQLAYFYKVPMEMGIFRTVPYTPSISTSEIIRRIRADAAENAPRNSPADPNLAHIHSIDGFRNRRRSGLVHDV